MKTVIQYSTFTLLGAAVILMLSFVVEKGIEQVDEMLVPCQHGTPFVQGKCRCDGTPFNGTYCSNCICEHGVCSTEPTTPFRNSDYGCRCPTQSKRFGFLCDQCNTLDKINGTCKGECKPEFFGAKCERICYANLPYDNDNPVCNTMRSSGGQCNVCNGHGTCQDGFCECDSNWFDNGRDLCIKTCPGNPTCSGHGTCKLYGDTPGCLCERGWNGPKCDIPCPGMLETGIPCNDNGICQIDFDTNTATCECLEKFRGEDCSIECPGDVVACNGHGTCDDVGVCTCQTNVKWSLPSCKCSDELTCNAKGTCNSNEECDCFGNNGGQHCLECKKNWHGENCDLYCDPYLHKNISDRSDQFGCYGHGTCLERGGSMHCTCNLDTTFTINVGGAVNNYVSYYEADMNCGECQEEYFPKQWVVNAYGLPDEYTVPCEASCTPATCNGHGVCNHHYGVPDESLCSCDIEHLDDESFCTECEANWYPLDFGKTNYCNRFCIASGELPAECDGTIDCVQCNGHGTCTDEGDCLCTDGYTGDECQIYCTSSNGLVCGGHGKCESNEIQLLMEHEFRAEGGIPLFGCTCDPQDPVDADSRIDWDEKLALGLVNGTLDPPPNPEYYGETCDYHCTKPPWEGADECNGMGNCSVVTIRAPNNADFSCFKDSDCLIEDIFQLTSADEFWSNKKGPFCYKRDEISGCEKSTDDCYEILLKQRPKKMRSEECVTNLTCINKLNEYNWDIYCQDIAKQEQPSLFSDCKSVASFCPAKTIPMHCKNLVNMTDGIDVSKKLNYHYEYEKRKYPFSISIDYRISDHALKHDDAEAIIEKGLLDYKLPDDFCDNYLSRYPLIDTVRENKQYVCNGIIQNTTICDGSLETSENNLYFPFKVKCLNQVTAYRTYEEALQNQEAGCKIEEIQKEQVYIESDGKNIIDNVCVSIQDKFPSCKAPQPCDFKPCSDSSYTCVNDGSKAICSTTGDLNSTCLKGVSERLSFSSYSCDITIPNLSCPKIVSFETNHAKHCLNNNPILSHIEYIGENEVQNIHMGKYIHFNFKASDEVSSSTILEFGTNETDVARIFVRQGQIQLNEVENLQACPISNPDCRNEWAYSSQKRYHIELEFNETHVTMTRKDTGASISKLKLSSSNITEVRTSSSYSTTTYEDIVSEIDIPSPYICQYETCDFDVSYREICSDIIRTIKYPSILSPTHNVLDTCSTWFDKKSHSLDTDYFTTEKVYETDWNIYCNFYNSFTEESNIDAEFQILENYTECREFVDPLDGNKTCIVNALNYNWSQSCSDLLAAKVPESIKISCPSECSNHLLNIEKDFCTEREELFIGNMVKEISGCNVDWYDYCLKDNKGVLEGKCSAVECNCDRENYEGVSGQACELHCPTAYDGTACAEGSNMGKCMYTESQRRAIASAPRDEEDNPMAFDPVWALEGECQCFLTEGTRACDIQCRDCNNGTYPGGQIGICDNSRGTCDCLPPYTNIIEYTKTDWRGKNITVIERVYGNGGQSGKTLYRMRQMQGKESFVRNELKRINLTTVFNISVSGTDHYVFDGENDPTISLCRGVEYTFHLPLSHPFRIVPEENCANKGCVDGKWLELPNGVGDYTGENTKHTFLQDGIYYYVCTNHPDMVGKFIVNTCEGESVYDGSVEWREIYDDFISNPRRYWCYDSACDESDVTMLGNLDGTSARYNYDCNKLCPGFNEETQMACSGNGYCGVTGECICDAAKITKESSAPVEKVQFIPGVEITNTQYKPSKLERTGYRGDECEIVCPGYDPQVGDMNTICNGHGTCDLAGQCACDIGYTGDECQFSCPIVDNNICNGHGTCEMAEISISTDIYDGFSRSCNFYADVGHCEAYAILNDLKIINVAESKIIGENEACFAINEEQCEKWGNYQDITYIYTGKISSMMVPKGCVIDEFKRVMFNTANSDAQCGTNDALCICESKNEYVPYCSLDKEMVIIHKKGGSIYTEMNGLYKYIQNSPLTINEAKSECESTNCLAIQEDPPASEEFYVVKSSTSVKLSYGLPYVSLNADCNSPVLMINIPLVVGMDVALVSCSERCRDHSTCSLFKLTVGVDVAQCYRCSSIGTVYGLQYDSALIGTSVTPRKPLTDADQNICEMISKDIGYTFSFESDENLQGGCLKNYLTKEMIYNTAVEFTGPSNSLVKVYDASGNEIPTTYYTVTSGKGDGSMSQEECEAYAELQGLPFSYANSGTEPRGCYHRLYNGDNRIRYNPCSGWTVSPSCPNCGSVFKCIQKQPDIGTLTEPECEEWAAIHGKSYGGLVHWGTAVPYGCITNGNGASMWFQSIDRGATSPAYNYYTVRLNARLTFSDANSLSLSQNECKFYAWYHGLPYASTSSSANPRYCFTSGNNVYYNTYASSAHCGTNAIACVQQTSDNINNYQVQDLIAAEKYKRYVLNPESLCIKEHALTIESKTQAPVVKSLRTYNDLCRYFTVNGLCPTFTTFEECYRYSNGDMVIEYEPGNPFGCYVENGIYKWNYDIYQVNYGLPNAGLSITECEDYASNKNLVWEDASIADNTLPRGCIETTSHVIYNPSSNTNVECSDSAKCIQRSPVFKTSGTPSSVSQSDCEFYANYFGDTNGIEVVGNMYPTGCFKTVNGFFFGTGTDGTPCSITNACIEILSIQNCSSSKRCVCSSTLYMDETTGICKAIEDEPIIKATFKQDRATDFEKEFEVDCQVMSPTTIKCAQCACFNDFIYGHWSGMQCSTCAVGYGKSQCTELCPDYDGETDSSMCGGFGQCLFGSERLDVERVFQEAKCICGQDEYYQPKIETEIPKSDYEEPLLQYSWFEPVTNGQFFNSENDAKDVCSRYNDIRVANIFRFCYGVFKRDNLASTPYELHMGNTGTEFITYGIYVRKNLVPQNSLSYAIEERDLITKIGSSEPYTCNSDFEIVETGLDRCNHFNIDSESCSLCEEGWTGKNCRAKCQKCLLRGVCEGKPGEEESAKCQCPSDTAGLWEYQCCPAGFRVTDLIQWNSLPQSQIDQIKVQKLYDPYTTNNMDSAYYCKKCPGVFEDDWMESVAAFKVCSGSTRGECIINPDNKNLVCECKLNELTGNTWKGRACSCDDSLDTPYSSIAASADSTDYGCIIPTGGTAVCPEPNPSGSKALLWYPYMLYAIGRSIDGNYVGSAGSFNKYLGPISRLSSPVSFTGGIASEIIVTTGVHGKCDEQTPCHTGEGPCVEDHDCAGALLCNKRIGETANINGYNPLRVSAGFRYCYDPLDNLIGCDPIPTFRNFDGTDNYYNYKYWDGTSFASATLGNYVPMTKDGNNDLVIHKRQFPCPKGKYGVNWDGQHECALCPAGYYQDQTGQTGCKSGCGGGQLGVISLDHCVECDAGYEPSSDFLTCDICQTGQYDDGSRNCESCPVNTFQLAGVSGQYGNNACKQCPAGTSSENSIEFVDYTKLNTCLTCDNGKFNANVESSCQDCGIGEFSHDTAIIRTKWGFGNNGVTAQECKEFGEIYGHTTTYTTTPVSTSAWNAGCYEYTGNKMYYNTNLDSSKSCAESTNTLCVKKENYVIVKKGIHSEVNYFYAKSGECIGGRELRMYESNSNADYVNQCYEACLTKKTPLNGESWSGFVLKGFIVASNGRCYCEDADSNTCSLSTGSYTRYDVGDYIEKITAEECEEMAGFRFDRTDSIINHPHGCMYDIRSGSSIGWYNTLQTGLNCEHPSVGCVKRARSGPWILQMPSSILHHDYDAVSASSEADCKTKCRNYLFMSWSTNSVGCRCANHNYGAGSYAYGTGVYQRLPSPKTECKKCPVTTSSEETGDTICTQCAAGKYQDEIGRTSCKPCPAGKYNDNKGRMKCIDCPKGRFADVEALTSCKCCASGHYQDQTGQTLCKGPIYPVASLGASYPDGSDPNGDLCMVPNNYVPNSDTKTKGTDPGCSTGLKTPPLSYFMEIAGKETVGWHGSEKYRGYYSSAQTCATNCYNSYGWIGFIWANHYRECWCESGGGLDAIKRCWYESDGNYNLYSILVCPKISSRARQYFDTANYVNCRL